jgi:hypothetical protein
VKRAIVWLLSLTLSSLILFPQTPRVAQRPALASGYISGRVVSGPSKPAGSIWVIVYSGATQKGRSLTGDDGKYYISGLAPGAYSIVVRKQPTGVDLFQSQISLPQNRIYNVKIR